MTPICTLFEGDYHKGVAVLVNSLYANGYRGVVWAGYRGQLPPWAKGSTSGQTYAEFPVAEGCVIRFVPLMTSRHLSPYKAIFMRHLMDTYGGDDSGLFYFDPDIVIRCRWSFYEEWLEHGVALCQEIVYGGMSRDHPTRLAWRAWAKEHGWMFKREIDRFFNGGFVGIPKNGKVFLDAWEDVMRALELSGTDLAKMIDKDRSYPFHIPDQDALNVAVSLTDVPISTLGPEGMDFVGGGFTMSHAAGGTKPWRKRFFREALRGKAPNIADKGYLRYCPGPITLYSGSEFFVKKLDLRLGSACGRFIRKS